MSEAETASVDDLNTKLDDVHLEEPGAEIEDDNKLALQGVVLLLNNKWEESIALFEKYKSQSVIMHFGGAFVNYMQAMMSMEDERMASAKKGMEEVEKKCKAEVNVAKKQKKKTKNGTMVDGMSQEDKFTSQIIVADAILYQAVLTFVNQDIPSYIKGGWMLRKAWKIYDKVYTDISQYHSDTKKHGKVKVKVDMQHTDILEDDSATVNQAPAFTPLPTTTAASESGEDSGPTEMMNRETIDQLLGAVSFGYGMFQLGISMLPDKVLKLIEFLGFQGDREKGLSALEFSMHSTDMRAPLAVLSMLWYHVIMKPFFTESLSEDELQEATDLIDQYQSKYPDSSLFLFFKGRLWRLKKNLEAALQEYQRAKEVCHGQPELKNAAMFEIAWCNMMKMNYDISYNTYSSLVADSKWSKCFYTYMMAICAGSQGKMDEATKLMKTVPNLVKKKTNQIEAFVSRRAQQFKKIKLTDSLSELLVLELVYLWNSLPQCNQQEMEKMLSVCGSVEEKKFFHLRSLIEGAVYKQMGDPQLAEQFFKEAIARHEGLKYDHHVAAHALFELGSYYVQSPETKDEGKKMLLKAKDGFKEYDFENRLNVRIRNVLKALDQPQPIQQ